jgi:hypothetical protein
LLKKTKSKTPRTLRNLAARAAGVLQSRSFSRSFQISLALLLLIALSPAPNRISDCPEAVFHVIGTSLMPLHKDGDLVEGHIGACARVPERGGLAIVSVGGETYIKIAVGMPGDRFALQAAPRDPNVTFQPAMPIYMAGRFKPGPPGEWNLLINGKIATNSQHSPYSFGYWRQKMLSLYVDDNHGVIPPHSYLVLGDDPGGTIDSTKFGLVAETDIIGTAP